MTIDPEKARAALTKEFEGLTLKTFGERLQQATPSWATPTKKTSRPKKRAIAQKRLGDKASQKPTESKAGPKA